MDQHIEALLKSLESLCSVFCQGPNALNQKQSSLFISTMFELADTMVELDPPPGFGKEQASNQVVADCLFNAVNKVFDPLGKGYKAQSEKNLGEIAAINDRLKNTLLEEYAYYQSEQGLIEVMRDPQKLEQIKRVIAHIK